MKKILCFFSALTLVLISSCSSDDNNSDSDVASILPKTVKQTYPDYPDDNSNDKITYDGNKIKNITSENYKTDYIYDGNLIVKQIGYDIVNGQSVKDSETSYSYSNGKLSASSSVENFTTEYPTGQYKGRNVYTYNADGTIKKEEYYTNATSGLEEKSTYSEVFTFQNGNLVKILAGDSYSSRTSVYEYDAKNSPTKNIVGFNLLLDESTGQNNLIKHSYTTTSNSSPIVTKTVYEYNSDGYPIKQTEYKSDGVTIDSIKEFTY